MTAIAPPPDETVSATLPPRRRLRLPNWALPVVGLVFLLLMWELIARTVAAGRHIIPTIPGVLSTMVADGFYAPGLMATLGEAGRGFLWGVGAALVVAMLGVLVPTLKAILTKFALATYCTPTIAVAPLLIVLFSPDDAKVMMAALSVFFPALLGIIVGLESAARSALEFAYVSGASTWFTLLHIRLRGAVPEITAALGLAVPAAVVGAMIGEFLGGDRGLGVTLVQAQQSLNVERAWAVAVVATGISIIAYLLIGRLAAAMTYTATSTDLAITLPQSGKSGVLRGFVRVVVGAIAALALWYIAVRLSGMDDYIAKTPVDAFEYLFTDEDGSANRQLIATGLMETLADASIGYVVGTVLAVVAAVGFLYSRLAEGMFFPVVMAIRAVPLVAMTPIIALVFGRGLASVAVLAGAVTFVPTLVLVLAALRAIPKPATDLVHVFAMGPMRALFTVRLPYAIPALAASARIAIPGAILGAVLVEILVTGDGIGYTIATSIGTSAYVVLWTSLAVLTAVTAFIYLMLTRVETTLLARISN